MPDILKLFGQLLTMSSTPERDRAVRRYLWQMKEIAKTRCEHANDTIAVFQHVILLVEELRLACIMQRKLGGSEFDLTKAILRLSVLRSNVIEMVEFHKSFLVLNRDQWRTKLLELTRAIEDEIELQDMNASGRMTRGIVYREAFQAMMLDYRISHVAEIYVTISEGYFLYPLAEISGFMVIDMNTKRVEATTPYIKESVKFIRQIIADENDRFNEGK
uniref:Uncharacterized protein n=1 Tax=Plectus sambesii TaxID=2011161 RepID=A0A914VSC0_9BILA